MVSGWVVAGWVAGAAMLALMVPVGVVLVRMRRNPLSWPHTFWWEVVALYCRWWCRLKRVGECTVPAEGPVLLVANHVSAVDPLLLVGSIPHRVPAFMIAAEFAGFPLASRLIRMIECIPVRRDGQDAGATKAAIRHLRAGKMLGIFIEGRIALPGETLDAKNGAALLATRSGAVVVPAFISGTKYHASIFRTFLRHHKARVRFGQPMDLAEYADGKVEKSQLGEISEMFLKRIRELDPNRNGADVSDSTHDSGTAGQRDGGTTPCAANR